MRLTQRGEGREGLALKTYKPMHVTFMKRKTANIPSPGPRGSLELRGCEAEGGEAKVQPTLLLFTRPGAAGSLW